jgi:hypothetical protein
MSGNIFQIIPALNVAKLIQFCVPIAIARKRWKKEVGLEVQNSI